GVHHGPRGERRPHDHRAQHGATAHVEREGRARHRGERDGERLMVDSPLPSLRAAYEQIAHRVESVTGGAEREAVKREIIAYFKQIDSLIGELSALKEDIRKLVERFKQMSASTAEASAPAPAPPPPAPAAPPPLARPALRAPTSAV